MAAQQQLSPHLTSTLAPPLAHEVLDSYQSLFYARITAGQIKPLVLPYHLYGLIPVAIYLCVRKRQWAWYHRGALRWAILVAVWSWQIKTLRETGSRSVANGLAAGLVSAWGCVWTAVWVWWRDVEGERRVRRRRRWRRVAMGNGDCKSDAQIQSEERSDGGQNKTVEVSQSTVGGDFRYRGGEANGHALKSHPNGHAKSPRSKDEGEWEYYWQPYPSTLWSRIPWILDLLLNFRGPGWSWAIPTIPPLSTRMKTKTGEPLYTSPPLIRDKRATFHTRRELAMYRVPIFALGYVVVDILKTLMMHDPYFLFGPTTYALPPHLVTLSPFALKLYRQLLGGAGVITALEILFSLPPLLTLCIHSSWELPLTATPPYYPRTWGSVSSILDTGLAGLWGTWWHQTFRFGFSAPCEWALRCGYLEKGSMRARLVALLCAFGLSGFLHAAASSTQTPPTKPWSAFVFFLLQAVGILLQSSLSQFLNPWIRNEKVPGWVRKVANVVFVIVWLNVTGNWLLDDFARGGVWLLEPVPVSFARGLGWGKGEAGGRAGFWLGKRWDPVDIRWWCPSGVNWWECGVAI